MKEEATDGSLWRTHCGRDCGPVVRQIRNDGGGDDDDNDYDYDDVGIASWECR